MRTLLPVLLAILFVPLVPGFGVDLEVTPSMTAEVSTVNVSGGEDVPRVWTVAVENNGSKAFVGRLQLDVSQGEMHEGIWSDAFVLQPGTETARNLAFYRPDLNGTADASIGLRYGTRKSSPVEDRFGVSPRDVDEGFRVHNAKATEGETHLGIIVPGDVETFFVSVDGEATRRFGQARVDDPGRYSWVSIPYHPEIKESMKARVKVFDSGGRYYYTGEHEIKRERSLLPSVDRMIGRFAGYLHVFFMRGN